MKKILVSTIAVLLCLTVSAQEKVDFLNIVEDVIKNDISKSGFIEKYQNFISDQGEAPEMFLLLENIDVFGHNGIGSITIEEEGNFKLVAFVVPPEAIDQTQNKDGEEFHKHMVNLYGLPDKEENLSYDTMVTQELNIQSGKSYQWGPRGGIVISEKKLNTDQGEGYMISFSTISAAFTSVVQRNFLKSLELGKTITKAQIANALEISEYSLALNEERRSAGKKYSYYESIYFGGVEWSFVEFEVVDDKLASVGFISSELTNNIHIYNKLKKALTDKYGSPNDYDDVVFWGDGITSVSLSHTYGKSKGGEMRYYVDLKYTDTALSLEAENIITNEL